jgi:hypothetical protein
MALVDHDLVGPGVYDLGVSNWEPFERLGDLEVELPGGLATANRIGLGPVAVGNDDAVSRRDARPRRSPATSPTQYPALP